MTGIRTLTRLEELKALLGRTRHEIACQRRRGDTLDPRLYALEARLVHAIDVETGVYVPGKSNDCVSRRLRELGITAKQVKVWAAGQGLIPAVVQGRVASRLVEAYAAAHPTDKDQETH